MFLIHLFKELFILILKFKYNLGENMGREKGGVIIDFSIKKILKQDGTKLEN